MYRPKQCDCYYFERLGNVRVREEFISVNTICTDTNDYLTPNTFCECKLFLFLSDSW